MNNNVVSLLLLFGSGGLVVYAASCAYRKEWPTADYAFESVVFGGLIGAAMHLTYCVFEPLHLVHFVNHDGALHHLPDGCAAQIDSIHVLEMLGGACAAVILATRSLVSVCKGKEQKVITVTEKK